VGELAVTAIGEDRPGIISRVTEVLFEKGGNLTDSTMTLLGGHFAIMLLYDTDEDPGELEAALERATADLGLGIRVGPAGAAGQSAPPTHVLTIYGSDRPGIVYRATTALADREVNVTDLTTRLLAAKRDVYACVMEVTVPADRDADAIAEAVRAASGDVEVNIKPLDVETF
jgi:glycine cleavage system transcriptional repressor